MAAPTVVLTAVGLWWRALVSFLALPGLVAFILPLWLLRPAGPLTAFAFPGWLALGPGLMILLWCVVDFSVAGRGTLAPWDPPHRLVVRGLYRLCRNPMYLGVLAIVAGWAVGYRSWALGGYLAVLMAGFHARVVYSEEPWLERTFGAEWIAYAARVRRWGVF